jgi:antitoxin MazE
MRSNIKKIGNSKGVVIPPAFLAEFSLDKDSKIEIELKDNGILIKPAENARDNWETMFSSAIDEGSEPEGDLYKGMSNEFDEEEWTW